MAISGCTILRSAATSPPLNPFRLNQLVHCSLRRCNASSWSSRVVSEPFPSAVRLAKGCCLLRPYSVVSILDSVLDELKHLRSSRSPRASCKMGVLGNKEVEDKLEKRNLEKGLLLEFRKDSERLLLAVAQRPDGKKNWMVCDQNGVTSSIRPQQITFVVPGVEDFDHMNIPMFLQKAQNLLDPSILECAWAELVEKCQPVTVEELAEIIYGSAQPLESYCTHLLLSNDEIYFTTTASKGFISVYQARPSVQVEELLRRKHAKEASERELEEFIQLLSTAKASLPRAKPPKSLWIVNEKTKCRIEALEAYAIDAFSSDEQRKMAGMILQSMGLSKTSSTAVNLLIDVGYFPVHVNLDLLKFPLAEFSDEVLTSAEDLLESSFDMDEVNRKDLTYLKVYAIDVDEADELDDALSATRLEDGRIKIWIHVADPSCFIQPNSVIDRAAMRRGTSIFLPTVTYPMFPEKLAMEKMSLQQGKLCNVVSISVILNSDGSIGEYDVENAVIRPTYMLTYESATELLYLNLQEEAELQILSEAASLRLQWRLQQGAIDTSTIAARVKVPNPDDPEPTINLYIEDQADAAMRLVTEMMLLCGEAIATFGSFNNIPLPYRGQPQSNISISSFEHLPEGPVRSSAYVKILRAAEMDFRNPVRHGILGLPAYVQFSSPIRRYTDMLAHYQVKAFLRDDPLPFSAGQLEGITSLLNMQNRMVKRLSNSSLRYWLLEYLRRQPKGKKFRAVILRFIKDRTAELLLLEVGIQCCASVSVGKQIGDEIDVQVEEAHPRDDFLSITEV